MGVQAGNMTRKTEAEAAEGPHRAGETCGETVPGQGSEVTQPHDNGHSADSSGNTGEDTACLERLDGEDKGKGGEKKGGQADDKNSVVEEQTTGGEAGKETEGDVKGESEPKEGKEGKTEKKKAAAKKTSGEKGSDTKEKAAKEMDSKKKEVPEKDLCGGGEGKAKDAEKQGRMKKKGGTTPPSAATFSSPLAMGRPRTKAGSGRGSAKKDLIAKFQQGAPEGPIARNFKVQRSATAGADGSSIKQKVLHWCQNKTRKYEGVEIENFSSSWSDGMAFCALIHRYFPDAFDFSTLKPKEREKNFTLAFSTAESLADCVPLLDVSDMIMMGSRPDPMCVFTYVQSLCQSLSKIEKERRDKKEQEDKEKGNKEDDTKEGVEDTPGSPVDTDGGTFGAQETETEGHEGEKDQEGGGEEEEAEENK